ncbi:CoiA-like domain protein [Bdellovibrio bacteriovorus]|uniref:CoiA-like domain protein n=2 Tax=Bdellovibrio bacteriovorus TaxID=959 RepID=A0A150WQZ6_BDEBC|nr:CoiA-like domain protein [Bdellovibrio bacteriovorus]
MQYALVDNTRAEATKGLKGICPGCGLIVRAKCGSKVIHHWAHENRVQCDSWWENETAWHRAWKELFPAECREVTHHAVDGEIHRADIKTPSGIYIEVQHSQITDLERLARERFYKNLVWIVDAKPFRNNFRLAHMLPHHDSDIAQDLVWYKAEWGLEGTISGLFYRKSQNPDASSWVYVEGTHHIERELKLAYRGQHQYVWKKPRTTWIEATVPVYLDFGEEWLCRLEQYGNTNLKILRLISKVQFLRDCMLEVDVKKIADNPFKLKNS